MPSSSSSPSDSSSAYAWLKPLELLRISPAALLLLFAALIAVERLHTYFEPMDRDLGCYATNGHEMHFGKWLYTDLPDQKPPAIHLTYYAGEAIAGYGRGQIYLLTVTASIITLVATYAACVCLFGSRTAGLWAAAFWAVISGHLWLEANQPNTEVFMNAFLMAGLAFLSREYRCPVPDWRNLLLAGACFAWATLYKQVIAIPIALVGLAYFICPPPGRSRLRAFFEAASLGLSIVVAWGALFFILAWNHLLQDFLKWGVNYNVGYAGSLDGNLSRSISKILPECMYGTLPLVVLCALGLILGVVRKRWMPVVLLICLAIGAQIAVALPGRFFPHYYQLWFPFLILGSGFAIAVLESQPTTRVASKVAGALLLAGLVAEEVPNYLMSADEWSVLKYGPVFVQADNLARFLCSTLKPEETFFQLGNETELYPMTGHRPVSAITGVYGLYFGKYAVEARVRMINELNANKPDLIVLWNNSSMLYKRDEHIADFIDSNYSFIPRTQTTAFSLYARRNSGLANRISQAPNIGSPSLSPRQIDQTTPALP